jgi:hypothetical protein
LAEDTISPEIAMRNRREFSKLAASLFVTGSLPLTAIGADDPPPITEEDLKTSSQNLSRIVLTFHTYQDAKGAIASDILDKDDKPLLSWRVAILPYIAKGEREAELFKQFKLNESWDSDHNKKLIEKMPKIYAPVRVKAKSGETFYQTFTGEGTLFVKHKPIYMIGNIPDGTSQTGLIFEAGEPVIWSKPVDLPFDKDKPLPKLGGLFNGICQLGLADGSVLKLRRFPDEAELKSLIIPDDGRFVEIDKLRMPKGKS